MNSRRQCENSPFQTLGRTCSLLNVSSESGSIGAVGPVMSLALWAGVPMRMLSRAPGFWKGCLLKYYPGMPSCPSRSSAGWGSGALGSCAGAHGGCHCEPEVRTWSAVWQLGK